MQTKKIFLLLPLVFSSLNAEEMNPNFAINPSWYLSDCECGASVSVDFLYWYAREDNLFYASELLSETTLEGSSVPYLGSTDLHTLKTSWDPGVRVAVGTHLPQDGWDLSLSWTYMKNEKKGSATVSGFGDGTAPDIGSSGLFVPWFINYSDSTLLRDSGLYESVSSNWKWWINRFDLEIGRRYFPGCFFSLRPFAGVSGYWDKTNFTVTPETRTGAGRGSTTASNQAVTYGGQIELEDKNWGIGLLAGIEPVWNMSACFALFSRFDMALMWGKMRENHHEMRDVVRVGAAGPEGTFNVDYSTISAQYGMQPAIDLAIGLRYEVFPCEGQYHVAIDAGWEHHSLLAHNIHYQGYAGTSIGNIPGGDAFVPLRSNLYRNDLGFGGFILRARVDF